MYGSEVQRVGCGVMSSLYVRGKMCEYMKEIEIIQVRGVYNGINEVLAGCFYMTSSLMFSSLCIVDLTV